MGLLYIGKQYSLKQSFRKTLQLCSNCFKEAKQLAKKMVFARMLHVVIQLQKVV